MIKRLFVLGALIGFLVPSFWSANAHQAPDPAVLTQWKSPEPAADHVHSNGKQVISYIPFATCVDAGLNNAKSEGKPLLVYIKKEGCPHCAAFEVGVLRQPKMKEYISATFVCTRVLAGSTDDRILKRDFGCNAYPHFVIFSKEGNFLGKWFGLPKSAKEFIDESQKLGQLSNFN